MTPDQRREYLRKIVDPAPPLTPELRAALRQLLRPTVTGPKEMS